MIVGLGVDLADLDRIRNIYARFGRRFAEKILSPEELRRLPHAPAAYLAGRFAAKEAAVKALGTGFSQGIGPRQIEICNTPEGKPQLRFLDCAARRAQALDVRRRHVSLSHDRGAAVALVVLED